MDLAAAGDPQRGSVLFATSFTPAQGLGPLYNNTSCLGCHNTPAPGGVGPGGLATALRIGQLTPAGFDPMLGRGGPLARAHSVSELGVSCALSAGVPAGANVTSVRNAPSLFGAGRLDAIPDAVILAGAVARGGGISGRPNLVDGRVSRFGWKGDTLNLRQFVGEAFRNELVRFCYSERIVGLLRDKKISSSVHRRAGPQAARDFTQLLKEEGKRG